jgi:hypothetical protein
VLIRGDGEYMQPKLDVSTNKARKHSTRAITESGTDVREVLEQPHAEIQKSWGSLPSDEQA